MVVTIYLMRKAGEPRIYTNTVGFEASMKERLIADGYSLFRVEACLPDDVPEVRSTIGFVET